MEIFSKPQSNNAVPLSKTACFMDLLPSNIGMIFYDTLPYFFNVTNKLENVIKCYIQNGYVSFWCAITRGFSLVFAETILKLKNYFPHIKLYGVICCVNESKYWAMRDKLRYENVVSQLNGKHTICKNVNHNKRILNQNVYMISQSSLMIAVKPTIKEKHIPKTIKFAKQQGLKTVVLTRKKSGKVTLL